MPGAAREIPDPVATTDQSAGQAAPASAPSDRGTAWMPQVTTPPGRAPEPHDGMVRRGQREPGAVIMSAGRAPRIASASVPASPVGTGQAATVTAVAAGPVAAGVLAAAASGQCRVPVSYLRVWMTCSRLGPGWPGASPVIRRTAGPVHAGAGGAAACPQAGLRAAGHQSYRHLRDVRYGRHRCASIAPGGT
jgi:hypothetical protein